MAGIRFDVINIYVKINWKREDKLTTENQTVAQYLIRLGLPQDTKVIYEWRVVDNQKDILEDWDRIEIVW